MSTAFITGITGMVGSHLADLLFVPFSFDRTGMQVIHYQPGTPQ
jgi:GDP-D-mannose dehydratase